MGSAAANISQFSKLQTAFAAADANRDGVIDWDEAQRAGISRREFDQMDIDHDGFITKDEFDKWHTEVDGRKTPPIKEDEKSDGADTPPPTPRSGQEEGNAYKRRMA